jgi:hypothetical protein
MIEVDRLKLVKRYGLEGAARFHIPNHTREEKHAPEPSGELTADRDGTRELASVDGGAVLDTPGSDSASCQCREAVGTAFVC